MSEYSLMQRIKVAVLSQLAFWLALPFVFVAFTFLPMAAKEWVLSALPFVLIIGLCFTIYRAFANRSAAVSSRGDNNG